MLQSRFMRRASFLLLPLFLISLLAAQTATEVEITSEPSHHPALENEYVRVFKVEVAPHASTLIHRHRHDYVFVTLGDSDVENTVTGKSPVEIKLADGETRFAPGNFAHAARDLSDKPFRNVTIELLQDEKSPETRSHWPMEGGDQSFPGGHVKILFVKDGARVAENDLEPGATVPSHHHDGPHLVVALTDLNLRSDVDGKGSMTRTLKAGDIGWAPGGYSHTLTNTGDHAAKFVTVEF